MQRADPPSTVPIRYWSAFRCQHWLYSLLHCWCWYQTIHERKVIDERYSSHMGKGNSKLWFSFSFVQNDVQCSANHSSVPISKHFLYTLLGALLISTGSIRYCNADVDTDHSSRVFVLDVWNSIFHPYFHSSLAMRCCYALGGITVSIRYCSVLFVH